MGTSAAGEPPSERVLKLQARRRELEGLLAAKNDELYKLCVAEVKLTGVVPPEAPADPPAPAPAPAPPRRRPAHRLSAPPAPPAPPDPPPPALLRKFAADTLPAAYSRHHSTTTEQVNKLHYTADFPDTKNFSRVHETHFSSSHPDITTQYSNMVMSNRSNSHIAPDTPLIYQYAAQLKARSPHLSGLPQVVPNTHRKRESSRRNTLQRTQTYHLTSHSDYANHRVEDISASAQQLSVNVHVRSNPTMDPHHSGSNQRRRQYDRYPSPSNSNYQLSPVSSMPASVSRSQQMSFGNSTASIYSERSLDFQERSKEKEWYESSLDSPSNANCAINLSAESYETSKKTLHRTPSVSHSRSAQDNINSNVEYSPSPTAVDCSASAIGPRSPSVPSDVPFESPQNCTVVESGKWIPYREESKPFEMSDFYKYSTKFRQNNNGGQKQKPPMMCGSPHGLLPRPHDEQVYPDREHWKHSHQL